MFPMLQKFKKKSIVNQTDQRIKMLRTDNDFRGIGHSSRNYCSLHTRHNRTESQKE